MNWSSAPSAFTHFWNGVSGFAGDLTGTGGATFAALHFFGAAATGAGVLFGVGLALAFVGFLAF